MILKESKEINVREVLKEYEKSTLWNTSFCNEMLKDKGCVECIVQERCKVLIISKKLYHTLLLLYKNKGGVDKTDLEEMRVMLCDCILVLTLEREGGK